MMSKEEMREGFEAWHCEQYKTKYMTGAPTRDMHNGVRDENYCSKKSQALWECWQETGGDVAKVEALKDEIEQKESGQKPVGYLDRIPGNGFGFRSIKCSPHAYYKIPVYTRSENDEIDRLNTVIEQQKNLIASLRAELRESYSIYGSACPVAVVLPDRKSEMDGWPYSWNGCIDKFKELNPSLPIAEPANKDRAQ
jgi:hypothetical protein